MSEPRAALEGVEVPAGMDAGEVAALVGDLLRAVAEARIIGRFDIARDLTVGEETWRIRLRGHRKGNTMGTKHIPSGAAVQKPATLTAEHERAIQAHLEAQGVSIPGGVNLGDILTIGGKIAIGILTAAATGEADVRGIRIPHEGIWDIHGARRPGS